MDPDHATPSLLQQDADLFLLVSHAPAALRPALGALFSLDLTLGRVVATTREEMIGEMRLAWWREALEALDAASAPAEPVLESAAAELLPRGLSGRDLSMLEDGWLALLGGGTPGAADILRHAEERGGRLFALAARLLGCAPAPLARLGEGWALADLAHRLSNAMARETAAAEARLRLYPAVPPGAGARAFAGLAALARHDVGAGLAVPRRKGTPARQARFLWGFLKGR